MPPERKLHNVLALPGPRWFLIIKKTRTRKERIKEQSMHAIEHHSSRSPNWRNLDSLVRLGACSDPSMSGSIPSVRPPDVAICLLVPSPHIIITWVVRQINALHQNQPTANRRRVRLGPKALWMLAACFSNGICPTAAHGKSCMSQVFACTTGNLPREAKVRLEC